MQRLSPLPPCADTNHVRLFVLSIDSNVFGYKSVRVINLCNVKSVEAINLRRQGVFGSVSIGEVGGLTHIFASLWNKAATLHDISRAWRAAGQPIDEHDGDVGGTAAVPDGQQAQAGSEENFEDADEFEQPPQPASPLVTYDEDSSEFTPLPLMDGAVTLPCSVDAAFRLLFSSGSCFTEAWRGSRGEFDLDVPCWETRDDGALERVLTFRAPLDSMREQIGGRIPLFGVPRATRIREAQRARRSHAVLLLDSESAQLDSKCSPHGWMGEVRFNADTRSNALQYRTAMPSCWIHACSSPPPRAAATPVRACACDGCTRCASAPCGA